MTTELPDTALLPLILVSVLATSTLSGILGMAGGIILMGIYASMLPVAGAMVLHGFTQLAANGSRAWILRRHVDRSGLKRYVAGTAAAVLVASAIRYSPKPEQLFLALGILPFAATLVRSRLARFDHPVGAGICGFAVTWVQLVAGVAGPLLDVFFQRTALRKEEVVATKALTQTLSHLIKIAYFVALAAAEPEARLAIHPWLLPPVALAAMLGTRLGASILERMEERSFRRATQACLYAIGAIYLGRAALAYATGA